MGPAATAGIVLAMPPRFTLPGTWQSPCSLAWLGLEFLMILRTFRSHVGYVDRALQTTKLKNTFFFTKRDYLSRLYFSGRPCP